MGDFDFLPVNPLETLVNVDAVAVENIRNIGLFEMELEKSPVNRCKAGVRRTGGGTEKNQNSQQKVTKETKG